MTLPATRLRYLFALERLCQGNSGTRAVEIAALLGVTRPSVHRMIEALKETGLIRRDGPLLYLTAQGREFLGHYKEDYTAFTAFFQKELGLSDMQAEDNAIALLGALCPKCRKALSNLLRNP